MLKYLDLDKLKTSVILSDEEIISKGVSVVINENDSIMKMSLLLKSAVETLLADVSYDKIYNFNITILDQDYKGLPEEDFESAINCALSCFFDNLIGGKLGIGRQREHRLDVPENLKTEVNCNMSLVKRAINYKTKLDRFQLTISSRMLQYILVGNYDE